MDFEVETTVLKNKDDFINTVLRYGDTEIEGQTIALLNFLEPLGENAKKYVTKYMKVSELSFMNMKILSVAIFYYNTFGTYIPIPERPESNLDVYLEDKYENILYNIYNEKGGRSSGAKVYKNIENLMTEENKLNIKINVASYLTFLEQIDKIV